MEQMKKSTALLNILMAGYGRAGASGGKLHGPSPTAGKTKKE